MEASPETRALRQIHRLAGWSPDRGFAGMGVVIRPCSGCAASLEANEQELDTLMVGAAAGSMGLDSSGWRYLRSEVAGPIGLQHTG